MLHASRRADLQADADLVQVLLGGRIDVHLQRVQDARDHVVVRRHHRKLDDLLGVEERGDGGRDSRVGGEARSRHLVAPVGIRPTQGMVVQAIFNMLGGAVVEAEVLDLFAGSGALGIEALSRGAARATFVDKSEESVTAIRRNLETLGYRDRAVVDRADVPRWLSNHPAEVRKARIVVLDPPYADAVLGQTLTALDALVAEGTLVVAEHGVRDPLPELARLEVTRERRYGTTSVTIATA